MRHRVRGRKLGRDPAHRRAMFRNMASSLIRTVRIEEDDPNHPKVAGRIVTTVAKAKALRPYVERLVTLARKAVDHEEAAEDYATSADRNTSEWKQWRESDQWQKWNQTIAPAVSLRRRAFALLRDKEALDILFDELAERFRDRPGGYTRVVRLANRRLGDAGEQALLEFVGERDRVKRKREAPVVVKPAESAAPVAEEEEAPPVDEPVAEEASPETATEAGDEEETRDKT